MATHFWLEDQDLSQEDPQDQMMPLLNRQSTHIPVQANGQHDEIHPSSCQFPNAAALHTNISFVAFAGSNLDMQGNETGFTFHTRPGLHQRDHQFDDGIGTFTWVKFK
jgi:hypothetical protein